MGDLQYYIEKEECQTVLNGNRPLKDYGFSEDEVAEIEKEIEDLSVIDVVVIIFPDGGTLHLEQKNKPEKQIERCFDIWKIKNKNRYKNLNVTSAVAFIKMLKSDFDKIPVNMKYVY